MKPSDFNVINLFDLENGVVVPTIHCHTLKHLKFIMDSYPDQYLKIYQYLFYMTCPNPDLNPFFNTKASDKEELILDQLNAEFSSEDDGIFDALSICEKLYETPTKRAFEGIKAALENISDYMRHTKITDGRDGNITAITNTAEKFHKVRESFKGTEKDLIDEQRSVVRGQQGLAYDQI